MRSRLSIALFLLILLTISLVSCLPSQEQKLESGYYVMFSFQFKGENADFSPNPALKMEKTDNEEYRIAVKKKDLAEFLKGKEDEHGVYWWNVVYVDDPESTKTWTFYGGTEQNDPSVPILKTMLDTMNDASDVIFYARIPDATDTIVGFGDNTKDATDLYFVGTVTGWSHKKMEYKGDGVYEYTVELDNYIESLEYKIWPANTWEINDTLKALAFNGKNYYATGPNGTYSFDKHTKSFKVIFDAHHSEVKFEPIVQKEIIPISEVKEKLITDPSTQFSVTVKGIVTYVYSSYIIIQDETDGIEVYEKGIGDIFERGDEVLIEGIAKVYDNHTYEIAPESSELIAHNQEEPSAMEITGISIDSSPIWFGKLVYFTGTVSATDTNDNVFFISDNATITVKNYIDYNFEKGKEYTVKGVVIWNYDRYKVVPRDEKDITAGKSIILDGNLDDWEDYDKGKLIDDTSDAPWGDNNKIDYLGVAYDGAYIYVAAKFIKTDWNGLFIVLDFVQNDEAATNLNQWDKKFEVEDHDFLIGAWNGGFNAWKVEIGDNKYSDVTNQVEAKWSQDNTIVEFKIPFEVAGFDKDKATKIKFVGILYGGIDDSGNQWAGDFAPNQTENGDQSTSGNPIKIQNYEEINYQ